MHWSPPSQPIGVLLQRSAVYWVLILNSALSKLILRPVWSTSNGKGKRRSRSLGVCVAAFTRERCQKDGWLCDARTSKLKEESHNDIKVTDCPGSFFLYVIYVTRCLLDPPRYQVSQSVYYTPLKFLSITLEAAGNFIMGSLHFCAIMICTGEPLWEVLSTLELEKWVGDVSPLDTMLCCLNKDIAPSFFATFLANLSTNFARDKKGMGIATLNSWLNDDIVCHHSYMLYWERDTRPVMWYYSPFHSRPFGKPLPDLSSVCSCQGLGTDSSNSDSEEYRRKFWHVSHNAKDGMLLRDVVATAECSICGRYWLLQTEDLEGYMHCYNGRYSAIIAFWVA
ncbi:hypothetical protein B0J17DRAFT_702836 [Rhizoctonia solani]|nr:hypothetical protein B0J17DRAFT_702836 [Rhizoctonia solani]